MKSVQIIKIKGSLAGAREALDEAHRDAEPKGFRPEIEVDGEVFEFPSEAHIPKWAPFLAPALREPLTGMIRSTSALMILNVDGEWFAVTLGHGRTKLDPNRIERRFGLKVCLNRLNPDFLRQMETRTLESTVLAARKQVSRPASSRAFRVDHDIDLLRAISGDCREGAFARKLAGVDSVEVTCEDDVEVEDIPGLCRECLAASRELTYREHGFDWVDHVMEVRTEEVETQLNALLLADILSPNPSAYMAPLDVLDLGFGSQFCFSERRLPVTYPHLDLRYFVQHHVRGRGRGLATIEDLKAANVYVRPTGEESTIKWPAFDCLIAEVDYDNRHFILNAGVWYEVAVQYSQRLALDIAALPLSTLQFPIANWEESEGQYNERVAREVPGLIHMDEDLIRPAGASSSIEICDLCGNGGKLIHVKCKSGSSALSHHFSQGAVSVHTLLEDSPTREAFAAALRGKGGNAQAQHVEQQVGGRREYEVAFVVLSARSARTGNFSLPFFSQVNLRQRCKELRLLGVAVSFTFVEQLVQRSAAPRQRRAA